jgi:hypothetical protein
MNSYALEIQVVMAPAVRRRSDSNVARPAYR